MDGPFNSKLPAEIGVAIKVMSFILTNVRLNGKILIHAILPIALLLLASGCGGINASRSVSPASFFLPGLIKAEPQPGNSVFPDAEANPVKELARAN